MFSIAIGKISVAFLIERIAGSSDRRKWLLRGISISVLISAVITFTLFYVQCQPAKALWDKGMIKDGTGNCWNPIPVNTWDLVIASRFNTVDCGHLILTWKTTRLLGILRFRSCSHPGRHCVEAPIRQTEEATADTPPRYGGLVSSQPSDSLMATAYGVFQSAGICAAVKTSKVPITVKAKTDITCQSPSAGQVILKGS